VTADREVIQPQDYTGPEPSDTILLHLTARGPNSPNVRLTNQGHDAVDGGSGPEPVSASLLSHQWSSTRQGSHTLSQVVQLKRWGGAGSVAPPLRGLTERKGWKEVVLEDLYHVTHMNSRSSFEPGQPLKFQTALKPPPRPIPPKQSSSSRLNQLPVWEGDVLPDCPWSQETVPKPKTHGMTRQDGGEDRKLF
jgi:hypothetical protein